MMLQQEDHLSCPQPDFLLHLLPAIAPAPPKQVSGTACMADKALADGSFDISLCPALLDVVGARAFFEFVPAAVGQSAGARRKRAGVPSAPPPTLALPLALRRPQVKTIDAPRLGRPMLCEPDCAFTVFNVRWTCGMGQLQRKLFGRLAGGARIRTHPLNLFPPPRSPRSSPLTAWPSWWER